MHRTIITFCDCYFTVEQKSRTLLFLPIILKLKPNQKSKHRSTLSFNQVNGLTSDKKNVLTRDKNESKLRIKNREIQ